MPSLNPCGIVTLLTDFGMKDGFAGIMKGVILGIHPAANIIDITHDSSAQNISTASFLLKSSFRFFPDGTVHVAVVDPGVGTSRKVIIMETDQCWFVAPDNGVLTEVYNETAVRSITHVTNREYFLTPVSNTFHGRDIFAPVAAHLSGGTPPYAFGRSLAELHRLECDPLPHLAPSAIEGRIRYIDKFGNLITNIDCELFHRHRAGRSFSIRMQHQCLTQICDSYEDGKDQPALAIFNSFNMLEIATYAGNAAVALDMSIDDPVHIHFANNSANSGSE